MANRTVLLCTAKNQVEFATLPIADLGPNDVLVRVYRSLISPGTEKARIRVLPKTAGVFPFEPGYCASGVVEAVGAEVTRVKPGDRVGAFCINHCDLGVINENMVALLPEGVSFEQGAFLPLIEIAMQGVRKARIELGETALVLGLGPIGQLAAQMAKAMGALPVIGVDRDPWRVEKALSMGCDKAIIAKDDSWVSDCGAPDAVIEATGEPASVDLALRAAGKFARVVLLGSTRGDSMIDAYTNIHCKGLTVIGAHGTGSLPSKEKRPGFWTWEDEFFLGLRLIEHGRIDLKGMLTKICPWQDAPKVYASLVSGDLSDLGIQFIWHN